MHAPDGLLVAMIALTAERYNVDISAGRKDQFSLCHYASANEYMRDHIGESWFTIFASLA